MEILFFIFLGILLVLAVIIGMYLNGNFTYNDEVIGLDGDIYTIKRTYHNKRVVIFKKRIHVRT